jgi:hypothetical protein
MFMHCRCPPVPVYRYRVLYVGRNLALAQFFNRALADISCDVSYFPATWLARPVIESYGAYTLFLFDEQLPETTGAELPQFAATLRHRARTPHLIHKPTDDFNRFAHTIRIILATTQPPPRHTFAP